MEVLDDQALKKIDSAYNSFLPCLKGILKSEVTSENLKDKIDAYIKSKGLIGLEKKIFELFINLNPTKKNFKSESNRTLIVNIFSFLLHKIMPPNNIEKENDEIVEEESKNQDGEKINEDTKTTEEEDKGKDIKTEMIEEKKEIDANEILKLLLKVYENDNLFKILFIDVSDICN